MTARPTWSDYGTHDRSAYPELWNGCVYAAAPCLGPTGSKLHDLSGYNRFGTLTNMEPSSDWLLSDSKYALSFDGVDERVVAPYSPELQTPSVTVSCWFYRTSSTANTYGRGLVARAESPRSWLLYIPPTSDAYLHFVPYASASYDDLIVAQYNTTLPNGIWHHVVGRVKAGSTAELWINGSLAATAANTTTSIYSSNSNIEIGSYATGFAGTHFQGYIDDVMVWDRHIHDEHIRTLYRIGRGGAYTPRRRVFAGVDAAITFTGTATPTQAANTGASNGLLIFTGTASPNAGNSTSTTTASLIFTGTSANTQANQTSTATGSSGATTGTAAASQASQTSTASGTVAMPVAGWMKKTPYAYLARSAANTTNPVDYSTTSFSVEFAVNINSDNFIGDWGEIIRHGQDACGFATSRPGWSIGTDSNGYAMCGGIYLRACVNGGGDQCAVSGLAVNRGKFHVVMTFDISLKRLTLYVNAVSQGSSTNASVTPTNFSQPLTIGGINKRPCDETQDSNGLAFTEFDMYLARIWSGALSSADVTSLYNNWNAKGNVALPSGITTGTLKNAWYFSEQVGNAAGAAGTGWVKDFIGGNHLKIVTTGVSGGPTLSFQVPSGSTRISSPANGATGVSGAVEIQADGTSGNGSAMQYYIEIDEVNTFNSGALKNSGWTLADGKWRPRLKPSTVYYARVKSREIQESSSESSWSSTVSFTTRAATNWYVRPPTTVGTYGSENGTSYANAWNDLRFQGTQDGRAGDALLKSADYNSIAPGDSLIVCDAWGLPTSSNLADIAGNMPRQRQIRLVGYSDSVPATINFDDGSHPATIYSFYKFTGSYNWVSEGSGVYSTTSYLTVNQIAVDSSGVPNVDLDNPNSDTMLCLDGTATLASPGFYYSAGKMYVKMPDGASPANKLWYLISGTSGYTLNIIDSTYVKTTGGKFCGATLYGSNAGIECTHLYIQNPKIKYCPETEAIRLGDFCDYWTIDGAEISYARNGIYGYNTGEEATRRTGDNCTVKKCYIHDIGLPGFYDDDSHAVGVQSGNDWTVEDNFFQNTGTAVEFWTSNDKEQRNGIIRRNVIAHISSRGTTYGAGIVVSNGAYTVGLRTGFEITDNVIIETYGSGMQLALADYVLIDGNLLINNGTGSNDFTQHGIVFGHSSTIEAEITNNVIVNPTWRFMQLSGTAAGTGIVIDNNVYYDFPATSADDSDRFVVLNYTGWTGLSFNEWKAATPFDDNGQYGNPLAVTLPAGFDAMLVDVFMGNMIGDINDDNDVDAGDLTALQADAGAPRVAPEMVLDLILNESVWLSGYGATTQASNTSTATGATTGAGTGSPSQASQTSAASGTLVFTGTSSQTQASSTSTASGTLAFTGTSANTQASQTATASGTGIEQVTGTAAATQANQTAVGAGALPALFKRFTADRLSPTFTADRSLT